MTKVVADHGQYVLGCEAVPMSDGRFSAMVAITRAKNGVVVMSRRFPDPQRFEDAADAVAHAKAWAVDWLEQHGTAGR
ncbi:hypothetical protein EOS_17960 [Caballeronia mineralivorans PML1(12)]|uniref:Uncharacterized protein n=1 Tax=Caballeronia mineralivorans PML1(12) TaxID=908627 RepID=A0A0J1CWC5_9BURK|nr:hypothetical protein [Caballeronia mineralivorans]KLU24880.1 hypothetical protein EOS_17960 [Caballeronia mineralivorans PML1(12)]